MNLQSVSNCELLEGLFGRKRFDPGFGQLTARGELADMLAHLFVSRSILSATDPGTRSSAQFGVIFFEMELRFASDARTGR